MIEHFIALDLKDSVTIKLLSLHCDRTSVVAF